MNKPRIRGGPAIVLGLTTSITAYAIFYSHFQQVRDKKVMREGVARDKERIRLKRKEQQLMQQQKEGVIESRDGGR
eukprot:scaffold12374_cov85-Skeletonema_menzelii.AAC.1